MPMLVDTPVWSLVLRRSADSRHGTREQQTLRVFQDRVEQVILLGAIRQEVLSGIRSLGTFAAVRDALRSFPTEATARDDYERAAEFYNLCRQAGVQGSLTDFLLCAVANRVGAEILTLDRDFIRFQELLPIVVIEN
jgi:predicted nucleic acid-binding protein